MEVSTWCEQLKIVISLVTCRKEMIISLFLWVPRYWKIYILHWTNFAKISALKFSFKIQKMYPPPQILQISLAFVIYLEHFPFFFFWLFFVFCFFHKGKLFQSLKTSYYSPGRKKYKWATKAQFRSLSHLSMKDRDHKQENFADMCSFPQWYICSLQCTDS